jgi:hypothetical protein
MTASGVGNAEDSGGVLAGLAEVATGLGLADRERILCPDHPTP